MWSETKKDKILYLAEYESPLGKCSLLSDENSLQGLWIEGQEGISKAISNAEILKRENAVILQAKEWLDLYFSGKKPSVSELSLEPQGNAFRQLVWKYLREIPYGQTTTYGEIAKKVARDLGKKKMSAQAVGGAVGNNPISIIIPCHRVIGKDGRLVGYAGGLDKKKKLLALEGIDVTKILLTK